MIPSELRTERLLLREWRDDDVEPLAEIYTQPEFLEHMPPLDLEGTRAQIARFVNGWRDDGFSHWAAVDRRSGVLVGRIGLLRHRDWPLSEEPVEAGWALHRDWWGRGLATEGGRAAIDCWREHLDEPQLLSITPPGNVRSRAVMERLGFTPRGQVFWRGHDHVWYAIDR